MNTLRISDDFHLPFEAVTQTFAILAKRGVGKTYTASVLVEEMLKAGLHLAVVDPIGVWWGLRASADGKSDGLPIAVLGGDHGDLPLTEEMGEAVADLLVDSSASMVIDLSNLRKNAQTRFMTAFAEALYHRNRNPLHLVLDEADAFAPQKPIKGQERMLGAMEDIVRRGRARGLGVTLITQRAAVLNKDVLTQVEVLVALRTIAPQDREAVDAWIRVHGTPEQRAQLMDSLPSLPIGTAWFWSPGWLDVFQQVRVRQRETFDSSATPKVGGQQVAPDRVAAINLGELQERLADHLKKADDQDVAKLQQKVARLETQLKAKPTVQVERVEVPVVSAEQMTQLKELARQAIDQGQALLEFGQGILDLIGQAQPKAKPAPQPVIRPVPVPRVPPPVETDPEDTELRLSPGETRLLQAIASRYPVRLTRAQCGTLAGFTPSGGTFGNYFGKLKRNGLVAEENREVIVTQQGIEFLGDDVPPAPQTAQELIAMWKQALPSGAGHMLDVLVECRGEWFSRGELGEIAGFAASGGTFGNYLGMLRRNGLIEEDLVQKTLRASETLFQAESMGVGYEST